MFSFLITSLTDKPLILQGEVLFTSLLGLKGLIEKKYKVKIVVSKKPLLSEAILRRGNRNCNVYCLKLEVLIKLQEIKWRQTPDWEV